MDNMENEQIYKSVIENGLELKNSVLTLTHDLRINGKFSGKIISTSKIFIDTDAVVSGDIVANELEIKGKVDGACFVKGAVRLLSGCKVTGQLFYGDLYIESGTLLSGSSAQVKPAEFEKTVKSCKSFKGVAFPSFSQSTASKIATK